MEAPSYLGGQLLLALPGIGDQRFEKAVIALCAHDANGALGIGVGKTMPRLTFHSLLTQLDVEPGIAPDVAIHMGGPVEPQRGFLLHTPDWGGEDTLAVGERWALTSTLDILRAIAEGRGPARWLCALGYAGWSAGQLDSEMTRHGWFATPGEDDLLFERPVDARWAEAFAGAGVDVRLIAPDCGTA
jgi:putative transcriptional regulator